MLKRIYLENYGCPSNKFDLEVMIAHLQKSGYLIAENFRSADVIVVNTCGVKKPTEDKIIHHTPQTLWINPWEVDDLRSKHRAVVRAMMAELHRRFGDAEAAEQALYPDPQFGAV
jgi:hypothetical protein